MSTSDIIEIIGIVASFSSSIVGIWISIKALKQSRITNEQNNRMLEESTRPFITIYLDAITICEQASYFVVKNFGSSPATITHFEYDPILKQTPQAFPQLREQFDFVENIVLAPGQSKLLQYNVLKLSKDLLEFRITYTDTRKEYSETVTMNVKNFIHLPVSRPESHIPEGNERQVHALREMVERTM